MRYVFNKTLLKFILLLTVIAMITGCTNIQKTAVLEQDMENVQILTGAVDVEGEGIMITLSDSESQANNSNNIIHDVDLIKIVNILAAAGAEVIAINDERLIPISKIKANKMMIQINHNEYGSPFVIKAIGNPETLRDALKTEEDYIHSLKTYISIEIEKKDKLVIPKFTGNIYFNYAKPVEEK